jgi:uncharacterized protein (TIGR00251 family)
MTRGAAGALPWQDVPGGLQLRVRLTPRSSRDALDGVETLSDGGVVLKVRVSAVPEDGKANEALVHLVARACRVANRDVSIEAGATSRLKVLRIEGARVDIAARLLASTGGVR